MAETVGTRGTLENLVEMLVRVPELADVGTRDQLVERVRRQLRRPLLVKRFNDIRPELSSLVNATAACSGGLHALASIVAEQHAGDISAIRSVVADLSPGLLSGPDRNHLSGLLSNLPAHQVAEAVDGLGGAEQLYSMRTWRDTSAAIGIMEGLPIPDDGVPQVLAFASRLSELLTGPVADGLRTWVDTVAGGLNVDLAALVQMRGGPGPLAATSSAFTPPSPRTPNSLRSDTRIVGGGVPIRNRNFTGRSELLDQLAEVLSRGEQAAVLPPTIHGLGGVGKTQLVVEYLHRHLDDYELVWWIPAEHTTTVLAALTQLAETLRLTVTEDRQQTARTVLEALAGLRVPWLLVYDNADNPDTLKPLLPATGGHVIVTTRNPEWGSVGRPIEVNVFPRAESIQMLEGRGLHMQPGEADVLADKLGDLPLALEQAALWCRSTAMPVSEYIELLDSHSRPDLLSESKPYNYPETMTAFVTLASKALRETAPAGAQLFELLAFLSGEPVSQSLLSRGKSAEVTEPLRSTLNDSVALSRVVRDLNNRGLAKVYPGQHIQVHRLVQDILRDILPPELGRQTLLNTQRLLAAANPGDPDERADQHASQAELGPHLDRARMIYAEDESAREVVLDHARYLYLIGDYENSLKLATDAEKHWAKPSDDPVLGPNGDSTLRARSLMANALRVLGKAKEAQALAKDTYDRMCASLRLGELHEFTLIHANQVAADLRIAGHYTEALQFDTASLERHRLVFSATDAYTLRAQANLAVDLRMMGDFSKAFEQDSEIARHWEDVGDSDPRALAAYINQARNFYGMGAYEAGLAWIEQWRGPLSAALGAGSSQVLLAQRTHAILLRKLGKLFEAREILRVHFDSTMARFGETHEFTNAAAVSYANVLRQVGAMGEAAQLIEDAMARYGEFFGERNPLTLAAKVNQAILLRAMGDLDQARLLNETCYADFGEVLGPTHPYTLCAGVSYATDLALHGDHDEACRLSEQMYQVSQEHSAGGHDARNGREHPYLLMRAINLSHDLRAVGRTAEADKLRRTSLQALRTSLGAAHPEVQAIERDERTEGDIEPPPT
ncbi:FxSxx-COOH system tetratricopeptide repeat protein [Catellatospora sichuanensis]|uniref:FxSxx-COOH system tetratricopeptide repeat protein n=1 Tax=Catellatospora sichuanensis TaxID=1969805 RepID=UPI0011842EE6|nr:FxSxx-COOH system tetratricopeptide repeat protein [Catellatospora sichuanensis]